MAFHVPPKHGWKPEEVRDSLLAVDLPARIESGVLRIDVAERHRPSSIILFFRRSAVYRMVFGSGYAPYHEFRFDGSRFVKNLEIHWNVDALAENYDIYSSIRDAMATHGYVEVGMKPTEREIVQNYGAISSELDDTLKELEILREDQAARQNPRQFWERWEFLNARMERLCVATLRV